MTVKCDDRGSVSVWVVLMVMALTLVVGISVDLSGQINAKRLAEEVASAAARAGAQEVDQSTYFTSGRAEVNAAQAKAAAMKYVRQSGMTGSARIESGTDLVVDTTAVYRPIFLSAAGINSLTVTGSARAHVVRVQEGAER